MALEMFHEGFVLEVLKNVHKRVWTSHTLCLILYIFCSKSLIPLKPSQYTIGGSDGLLSANKPRASMAQRHNDRQSESDIQSSVECLPTPSPFGAEKA